LRCNVQRNKARPSDKPSPGCGRRNHSWTKSRTLHYYTGKCSECVQTHGR
jgi:hypothetical protein